MTRAGREWPDRPLVGVAAVVLRAGAVLMVRRARPPMQGALSFPGGGQRLGETAEACARRELWEEAGVEAGPLRLVAHADVIDRAADGSVRFHYTVLDFAGDWLAGEPRAGGDASGALFVAVDGLEAAGVDASHRLVVSRALAGRVSSGGAWAGSASDGR